MTFLLGMNISYI